MEGLKSASLGAMGSLLRKLDELVLIEGRVRQLRDDLGGISTKLRKLSEVDKPSLTVNYWMKDVRELSYDMEDCVDQFIHADDTDTGMALIDNLLGFENRLVEAIERYDRFKLDDGLSHHPTTLNHHFRMVHQEPSPVIPAGVEGPTNELRRLVEPKSDDVNDLQLKVVSILGVEGVGKSMLSQKLWCELGGQFECRAFVQTAKKPDMRMILRSILSQIKKQQPLEACQVPSLIHDIRKHLKDKRYFIIIDDLWAVPVWDTLSRSFPDGYGCSRIITTTTIEDVALACCSYDPEHIFRMRPLSAEHSNQLFIKRVFATGEGFPEELIDVLDDITRKCSGLPLAIICLASLVASQPENVEQLIQKFLSHKLTSASSSEVVKQVLKLCYNSLPHSLKTCLLYLSIYPENYLILKDDLMKQWIAEDFIYATEEKGILEVASSYFDELLSLGLIQQMATSSTRKGVSYLVHPTVFDFITCKSIEDNFITTIDYSQSRVTLTDKIRRLSLHFGSAIYATLPASIGLLQVRSLAFMGLSKCMSSLVEFRFVRIVILHLRSDDGDTRISLAEIDKLLLLRYFQVRCNVEIELPNQMQCLKHFETLEINAIVAAIPSDIAHVPRLLNVCIGGKKYHKRLTLGPVALGKAMSMDDSDRACTPSVQIFELLPPICFFSRLPKWILQLRKLHIVEIVVRDLHLNDIDVFSELPVLTALSLYVRKPTARQIVFRSGSFLALEYFKFVCGVLLLNFQEEAMPNLRRLKIGFNAHRGDKYNHMLVGIQHLLSLKEITAGTGTANGDKEPDSIAALRDAIGNHPYHPSFKVKTVDPVDEEYDHSEIQNWSQETQSSSEREEPHDIQEDSSSIKHPRNLPSTVAKRQNIIVFTEDEIKIITSNYSTLIGNGRFGKVYRGTVHDNYDLVAVKKYIRQDLCEEFMEEVSINSMMTHKNVVELIGYCIGESTVMLVTEYISNGNLEAILHKSDISIPLDIRLGIAIGCAEALSYMHSMHLSSNNLITHGNIKPANILLDDNLTTKVSDFGLLWLLLDSNTKLGTTAYMDPRYFHKDHLTPKSDVYSFGMVLFELITRKRVKHGDINLTQTFNKAYPKGGGLRELFDAAIADENNMKILYEMRKLAAECVKLDFHTRPQMNDVSKRLRMLKKGLTSHPKSILATHSTWQKMHRQGTIMPSLKKRLSFFKGGASTSKLLAELSNVRIFTEEEINEVTHNYSYLLSGSTSPAGIYEGMLEDNTPVVVHKFHYDNTEESNGVIILSKIFHRNIIKVLGCCLDIRNIAFVYEYVARGNLSDILGSQEDLPLDLRMRIAIKTAEALEYLHSSATGIIGHGGVAASTILIDDNFEPKLTKFSRACKLFKKNETTHDNIKIPLEKFLYNDPSNYGHVLRNLESDVYNFGGVLMALVSREKNIDHDDFIIKFTKSYDTDKSWKVMIDKDIKAEEDIALLEEIGRLALQCRILKEDEMVLRPTMKEVAEHLHMLRRSWKERTTKADKQANESKARFMRLAEPRLPNLMRHLFGYKKISTSDPINIS